MGESWIRVLEIGIGVAATIAAAFMGARAAFHLEQRRDQDARRDRDADGLQSAIFVLCRQLSLAARMQRDVLDPLRYDRHRDIRVPVVAGRLLVGAKVDFDWVSHMLRDHEDSAALAFLIMACDDSVANLHDIAEARSEFHRSRIQPKLEAAGITEFSEERAQQIRYVCGATDSELLQRYTDQLYDACDNAVRQLELALSESRRVSQLAFPGYTFNFVLPDWLVHADVGHVGSTRALPTQTAPVTSETVSPAQER